VNMLTTQSETMTNELTRLQEDNVKSINERNDLENKLQSQIKETEFVKQRLSTQRNFLSQMEKSLEHLRKQNVNLNEINQKLTTNLNLVQTKQSHANTRIIELESQLAEHQMKVNILTEKESILTRNLDATVRDSTLQDEFKTLIGS